MAPKQKSYNNNPVFAGLTSSTVFDVISTQFAYIILRRLIATHSLRRYRRIKSLRRVHALRYASSRYVVSSTLSPHKKLAAWPCVIVTVTAAKLRLY